MSLSALTLQQLRYIVAVDQQRSFSDAATVCRVSQPALSAQVKKVEELLGLCIFDRSRQPILPTERGAKVVVQARRALEQIERIGLVASEGEDVSGPYRLGVIPTLASTVVPLFLPQFVRRYPDVSLHIVEIKTEAMIRQLREGSLDGGIAATPLDVPGIAEHTLCNEPFYAYLPPGHALAVHARVRQADLLDDHLWLLGEGHCFRAQVLALCSAVHTDSIERACHADLGSLETLVGLVDAGFGITVLPELFVDKLTATARERQVRAFVAPQPVRQIGFLHAREHLRWAIGAALFRSLRERMPSRLRTQAEDMAVLPVIRQSDSKAD